MYICNGGIEVVMPKRTNCHLQKGFVWYSPFGMMILKIGVGIFIGLVKLTVPFV
jgi:hypothetical protein